MLAESIERKYAVGAFDTLDLVFTEAIISAAEAKGVPVILMVPDFMDTLENPEFFFPHTIDRIRRSPVPIAFHLDRGGSFEACMKAIHYGCSSVMFDGSSLPLEENIAITSRIVEVAHACGVSVEAEVGHVASGDGELIASEADTTKFTRPDDAVALVERTGVDALAVAVGTVHGVYKGTPKLELGRLSEIRSRVAVPLVLHGGSGLPARAFKEAIAHGINKINFFTVMSLAAVKAMQTAIEGKDGKLHYIDVKNAAHKAVVECVKEQIDIFGTLPLRV